VEQLKPSNNNLLKPLPDESFFMHNFSIHGMRTVNVLEIDPGKTVEMR
jgi:hypothetical protein